MRGIESDLFSGELLLRGVSAFESVSGITWRLGESYLYLYIETEGFGIHTVVSGHVM